MKVCYIDLSCEDMSRMPARYGGGRIFPAHAKDQFNEFFIFADESSFTNVNPRTENLQKCFVLTKNEQERLKDGENVKNIIKNIEDFDIIIHSHVDRYFNIENLKVKQASWLIGSFEKIHPQNIHIACFNRRWQRPILQHNQHKFYDVMLGVPIPEFQEYKKENYLVQITGQSKYFNSIFVADTCNKFGIPIYFGGPIEKDYPLLEHIDNKNSHYLGQIKQEEKMSLLQKSCGHPLVYGFEVNNVSLSAMEALSYGTPILCSPMGYMAEWLKPGKNGWFVYNERTFLERYEQLSKLSQKDCYDSIKELSIPNMLKSFEEFVTAVINE